MDGRLVVVGASIAGLRAAEAARGAGWEGPITLDAATRHVAVGQRVVPYDALVIATGAAPIALPGTGVMQPGGFDPALAHAYDRIAVG